MEKDKEKRRSTVVLESIEIIEVISNYYKITVNLSYKRNPPSKGIWIVKAMGKHFRSTDIVKAIGEMASFVYNAHEVNKIKSDGTEHSQTRFQ